MRPVIWIVIAGALWGAPRMPMAAQTAPLEERARQLGGDAAQAARSDPAHAESMVAARYREALTLGTDAALRGRITSAFLRGFQEAGAVEVTPLPPSGGRIFDIATARDVMLGRPVGASAVFTPDTNPIYVWFRHLGFQSGAVITAVWYFIGTATPVRLAEGSVTITPPADWGQFSCNLSTGERWPTGDYRIDFLVGTQLIAQARFRVEAARGQPSTRCLGCG